MKGKIDRDRVNFFSKLHLFRGVSQGEASVKNNDNYQWMVKEITTFPPLWPDQDAAKACTRLPEHAVVGR